MVEEQHIGATNWCQHLHNTSPNHWYGHEQDPYHDELGRYCCFVLPPSPPIRSVPRCWPRKIKSVWMAILVNRDRARQSKENKNPVVGDINCFENWSFSLVRCLVSLVFNWCLLIAVQLWHVLAFLPHLMFYPQPATVRSCWYGIVSDISHHYGIVWPALMFFPGLTASEPASPVSFTYFLPHNPPMFVLHDRERGFCASSDIYFSLVQNMCFCRTYVCMWLIGTMKFSWLTPILY